MKNKIIFAVIILFSMNVFAENGIFQMGMKFQDEKAQEYNLDSLMGKKVIMAMAYTSCQGTCPLIVNRLKKIENLFKNKNEEPEIVVITYDYENDNSNVLNQYFRNKMGVKGSNWHFLVGSEHNTRFISMLLGIKFAKNKDSGMIIHDNKIISFNQEGKIVGRLENLDEPNENLLGN